MPGVGLPEPIHSFVVLAISIGLSFSAGLVGAQFRPGAWYAQLAKPRWTPPDSIFGPVWSVLYVMMGVAAWLVWLESGIPAAAVAFTLFVTQLVLNAAWSWLFFGLRRPDLAFGEILLLWAAILATLVSFCQVRLMAGVILIPHLVWISYVALLNYSIWKMNR